MQSYSFFRVFPSLRRFPPQKKRIRRTMLFMHSDFKMISTAVSQAPATGFFFTRPDKGNRAGKTLRNKVRESIKNGNLQNRPQRVTRGTVSLPEKARRDSSSDTTFPSQDINSQNTGNQTRWPTQALFKKTASAGFSPADARCNLQKKTEIFRGRHNRPATPWSADRFAPKDNEHKQKNGKSIQE